LAVSVAKNLLKKARQKRDRDIVGKSGRIKAKKKVRDIL